eukprot:CAMPEP_0177429684 /NCGR_PEP_ID=MMETSP0368-20130122/75245_1 /TAXON_ID=447022 ORGANISM="Scrippsiella hangoei-like, Strain SHHI-4" /NCGR_SAMPLE_ID=MMETSP0368 /ASSEMBLY_ACC=CAM_ASM_000363 /LENGTH=70 /DNA_ID=CAMNT_0018900209 /DNA_START=200 /DNA_END=412 /DNA_ORIENTATION=-
MTKTNESFFKPMSLLYKPSSLDGEHPPSAPALTRRVSPSVYVMHQVFAVPLGNSKAGKLKPNNDTHKLKS